MSDIIIVITQPCVICGRKSKVAMLRDHFEEWESGKNIQNVVPEMPVGTRELLITGTHEACWNTMSTEEMEEEEGEF